MVKILCYRNILKHAILPGFVMDNNYIIIMLKCYLLIFKAYNQVVYQAQKI